MFAVNDIFKSFGDKSVLNGASLDVSGETVALMGASGSGKTTLLRIVAGLEKADGGDVYIEGRTAVVFAEPRLFPNVRVLENVVCVADPKTPKAESVAAAREILGELLLFDALNAYPSELSSGMAARVALARALMVDADNYLLDEPFGALDDAVRETVVSAVKKRLEGKSVLLITHSESDAKALASRTLILSEGKIR